MKANAKVYAEEKGKEENKGKGKRSWRGRMGKRGPWRNEPESDVSQTLLFKLRLY
jgi:hypothetical protein